VLSIFLEKLQKTCVAKDVDSSVPTSALISVVTSLPRPVTGSLPTPQAQNAYHAISKTIIPFLVQRAGSPGKGGKAARESAADDEAGYTADMVDVLIEVGRAFGSMLTEKELQALETTVMGLINDDKTNAVVKKKAVAATPVLMIYFSDHQLSALVSSLIESLRNPHLTPFRRRYLIATIGAMARANPVKFGPYLKTLAPFVLSALSLDDLEDEGDDIQYTEVLEVALVALESLLAFCSTDMRVYAHDSVNGALKCLKYDPNVVEADDEEMGGTQEESYDDDDDELDDEDDDFEADGGYSDIDDMSWKVRRGAAKVLGTAASTSIGRELFEDGTLYQKVAPALISRFAKEREESVKLEVISAMSSMVLSTGTITGMSSSDPLDGTVSPLHSSRKRRRQLSDASMYEFQLPITSSVEAISPEVSFSLSGTEAQLARLIPDVVAAISKTGKGTTIPTKQALMVLLKNITTVLHGGLGDHMQRLQAPIADALKGAGFSGSSALTTAGGIGLQIDALTCVGAIAETHRSSQLLPYLKALLPGVISAVQHPNYKVSSAGLDAVEQIIKVYTPPRVKNMEESDPKQLETLFDVVKDQVTATKADLEVRSRAIRVLGSLLARTSDDVGMKLIPQGERTKALDILLGRLKNETTRLYASRAVGEVVHFASSKRSFSAKWIQQVTIELGAQLRKSDRALRGSCLDTLKNICNNPIALGCLDPTTIQETCHMLLPLLNTDDLHLLTPSLLILARVIPADSITPELIQALCSIVAAPLSGSVLNSYLLLIRTIGEQNAGAALMEALLKNVGVNGDPSVVGKAIGSLLVFGADSVNVRLDDFVSELRNTADIKRQCLALSTIGEAALRLGEKFPLGPQIFISSFQSTSDEVRLCAAVALGSAASTDMQQYLPVILKQMDKNDSSKYLLLHSIKEILQHPASVRKDVAPYSRQLWDYLVAASDAEDNRAVGAECLGRLALLDPMTFLPLLQVISTPLYVYPTC
jgi:cullin-associated NEDD8-dissociated protein 1